jgi:hypothetical protein
MSSPFFTTRYLGGAVATHVRVQDGLFPVFFPVMGALLLGGLFLDSRLRAAMTKATQS